MRSLWFVTPAWQRYELTAACLAERAWVIEKLRGMNIEGHCVVVADDENLDIARDLSFDVVERNNDWLGRKFNDGMEYAGTHGADFIVPIGSDSWIHPDYFRDLREGVTRTAAEYAAVEPLRMVTLQVGGYGAGPYVFERSLLEPSGFRPAEDHLRKSIDRSTMRGIGQPIRWRKHSVHALQYIGFRQEPLITSYEVLKRMWGRQEYAPPWPKLAELYPTDLVEMARKAL